MSKITCRICKKQLGVKGIALHLKTHKMTFQEYLKDYLDDFRQFGWTECPVCQTITKGTTCSRECMGKWRSENFSGKNHPWWNRKHTEKTKKKISKNRKGKGGFPGDSNPSCRPEVRAKISKTRIERGVARGKNNPMYGKTHTEEALRKIFDKRSMTKPEQIVAKILDNNDIGWSDQWFLTMDGNTYSYDFRIDNTNLLIEVDGDYWHGGPGVDKHWSGVKETMKTDEIKDSVANKLGYTVIRIWESEIKDTPEIITEKLNVRL